MECTVKPSGVAWNAANASVSTAIVSGISAANVDTHSPESAIKSIAVFKGWFYFVDLFVDDGLKITHKHCEGAQSIRREAWRLNLGAFDMIGTTEFLFVDLRREIRKAQIINRVLVRIDEPVTNQILGGRVDDNLVVWP